MGYVVAALTVSIAATQGPVFAASTSAEGGHNESVIQYLKDVNTSVEDINHFLIGMSKGLAPSERDSGSDLSDFDNNQKWDVRIGDSDSMDNSSDVGAINSITIKGNAKAANNKVHLLHSLLDIGNYAEHFDGEYNTFASGSFYNDANQVIYRIRLFETPLQVADMEMPQYGIKPVSISMPSNILTLIHEIPQGYNPFAEEQKTSIEEIGWYIEIDGVAGMQYSGALDVLDNGSDNSHTISGTLDGSGTAIIPIQGNPQIISVDVQDLGQDGGLQLSINDGFGNVVKSGQTTANYGIVALSCTG